MDDESPMRTMLGRVLRLADYRVAAFASGEEFLASLSSQSSQLPTCAILDIHLSGLSGFEVQMRMSEANLHIPVVFITASDDLALGRMALDADASRLLRKPFSSDELLAAIGTALSGKDASP
ncbi:response regulator transcription factor [Variovorax sp. J22R115]|uniref:response regulator transcription factor n=1 Tax=Variovorax sp. J22R115 TaxID=3053509 RepID=UPI002577D22E|nr:response regulator [Variovorax sp. J22R115]MDM0052470.1 response regulator [Variovorax sp. J22R115]